MKIAKKHQTVILSRNTDLYVNNTGLFGGKYRSHYMHIHTRACAHTHTHTFQCIQNKTAQKMNIAVWNVRTFIDRNDADRPHRCTALIASKLAMYKIDIPALSETRLAGKGEQTEKSSDYSFFRSGRAPDDKRETRVGYAIKTSLLGMLTCSPKGVNDRLMTIRLLLHQEVKIIPRSLTS